MVKVERHFIGYTMRKGLRTSENTRFLTKQISIDNRSVFVKNDIEMAGNIVEGYS